MIFGDDDVIEAVHNNSVQCFHVAALYIISEVSCVESKGHVIVCFALVVREHL